MNKVMIKSCPFCDSLNIGYVQVLGAVLCSACGATGPKSPQNAVRQIQRAVSTWNVRLGGGRPVVEMARIEDDDCWEQAVAPLQANVTSAISPENLNHVAIHILQVHDEILTSSFDHRRMTKK